MSEEQLRDRVSGIAASLGAQLEDRKASLEMFKAFEGSVAMKVDHAVYDTIEAIRDMIIEALDQ